MFSEYVAELKEVAVGKCRDDNFEEMAVVDTDNAERERVPLSANVDKPEKADAVRSHVA